MECSAAPAGLAQPQDSQQEERMRWDKLHAIFGRHGSLLPPNWIVGRMGDTAEVLVSCRSAGTESSTQEAKEHSLGGHASS